MASWFDDPNAGVYPQPAVQPTYQRLPAAAPAPTPTVMPGPTAYNTADPRAAIMPILKRYAPGPEGLRQAWPEIQRLYPGAVLEDSDEFVIPGYGRVDVGKAFEGGDPSAMAWVWQHGGTRTAGAGGLPSGFSMGTFTGGGRYPLASVMGPGLMQPWTSPFSAPDPNAIRNLPDYQFQMKEGLDALQRSAAAKGTLLTGGTLKALNQWAQGLASTYNDKYYGRALGEYQMAHDIYNQNQTNQFNRLSGVAGLGMQPNTSSYAGGMAGMLANIGNAQAAGQVGSANAWGGALGNLGNLGSQLWYMNYLRNQPQGQQGYP